MNRHTNIFKLYLIILAWLFAVSLCACSHAVTDDAGTQTSLTGTSSVPAYSGMPYVSVNNNIPYFNEDDYTTRSYEYYSELDSLGRCGVCIASIGRDLMPSEERGPIGSVRPSGWHTVKYNSIDGLYLYNRCHLIGYQLTGENANINNLITGTRYLNVQGMLPFEDMTADYVRKTGNHVLYRATPLFDGSNLVADGVFLEGYSVEDNGSGICFNVFCYNVQPGIVIDYATGDSYESDSSETPTGSSSDVYIINTNTGKFHLPGCSSVSRIKEHNKKTYTGHREDLIAQGYMPCKLCNP